MKAAVVSDLHLDYASDDDYRALTEFVYYAAEKYDLLVINGDAFDSPSDKAGISDRLIGSVKAFYDFIKEGGRIHYIAGNHDIGVTAFTGSYREYGFEIHYPAYRLEAGRMLIHFEHGHSCDPFYRSHLYDIIQIIEGETGFELGENIVRLLEETARVLRLPQQDGFGVPGPALKIWEKEAQQIINSGVDLVCMGHTHKPVLKQTGDGIYANSGCWPEKRTFLELKDGYVALKSFSHETASTLKKLSF